MIRVNRLTYNGFTDALCECNYIIETKDGRHTVIFIQTPRSKTSITNMIEVLASKILAHELTTIPPKDIEFYEYYDPSTKPIYSVRAVSFSDTHCQIPLVKKIFGVGGRNPVWIVDSPLWRTPTPDEINNVNALVSSNEVP